MKEYTATLYPQGEVTVNAPNISTAIEEAVWEYGKDHLILAVAEVGTPKDSEWRLVCASGMWTPPATVYPSLEAALLNNDDGEETLVAIPA